MAFNAQQAKRAQAVIVIAVLVIVAAIAAVVLSGALNPSAPQQAATSDTQTFSTAADDGSAATSDEHDMSHVDANYTSTVEALQEQFDADPTNPSALLQLANGYFDWGVSAMSVAQTDEDSAHVTDLFNQAIARYDDYLEDNPGSKSVEVDRAICIFYTGETDRAIAELEELVARDDAFGPAWANLGMFYESEGRTDDAKAAYERAVDADENDAYGVKTYAQQRLDALNEG